jgi:CarD family transcriptional regulator
MEQYSVGDKVMHPHYGPGQIVSVEHRELVQGFEKYYVIQLLANESTLYIPTRQVEEVGLRPVMSQAKLARVLATLRAVPKQLSKDFKVRQARIRDKLASARPIKVAEAVRDLTNRRRRSYLTKVDTDLLNQGRDLLASEMAASIGTDVPYGHQTLDAALKVEKVDKPGVSVGVKGSTMPSRTESARLVERLLGRARK